MKHHYRKGASPERVILVAVFVVSALFVWATYYTFNGAHGALAQKDVAVRSVDMVRDLPTREGEKDSDGDGIPDWEELLLGTNPDRKDSDGDGVPDQRITTANTSPMERIANISTTTIEEAWEPKNATELVASDIFGKYIESIRTSGHITPEEQEMIARSAIAKADSVQHNIPRFSLEQTRVVPTTKASIALYIKSFRFIINTMLENSTNEFEYINMITRGDRGQGIKGLRETIHVYKSHINELANIPVPEDAVEIHTDFMDSLLGYIYALEKIAAIEEDPVGTMSTLAVFAEYNLRITNAANAFKLYEEKNKSLLT